MAIQVGDAAPDFALPASNGETVRLGDFRGQPVVLYFYPKDAVSYTHLTLPTIYSV